MSDKSFGDHTNRNIVKNPLLSSAVTGLSLEDLTHKAVLLPVTPSLDQNTRSDEQQGSQARTLTQPQHETSTFPSGDAFSNITLTNVPQTTNQTLLDNKKNVNVKENLNTQTVTESKPSAKSKSDDDFDVNEYIARLQGTRYVSAPLHSNLKEGQNANLEETEENLEEINLNESNPVETQQSLTADIAQNFSQLPTVLPHVASAVFSSFSNMLSYKSREQTPDPPRENQGNKRYDELQIQGPDVGVPLMGVEEYKPPKEVAPPPKELPVGGASNFRIPTKKKYAQIPGLSTRDTAQNMTYPPVQNMLHFGQDMPTIGQNMPPHSRVVPHGVQDVPLLSQNIPTHAQNTPEFGQNMAPLGQSESARSRSNIAPGSRHILPIGPDTVHSQASILQHGQNLPTFAQNVPFASQGVSNNDNLPPIGHSGLQFVQSSLHVGHNEPSLDLNIENEPKVAYEEIKIQESNVNTPYAVEKQSVFIIFNPTAEKASENKVVKDVQPNVSTNSQNLFSPVDLKDQHIQSNPGNAAIIPPPPMFSNLPRRDNQVSVKKSVLPPSVARRISANQPVIKPAVSAHSLTESIFVPAPMPDVIESTQTDNSFSSEFTSAFVPAYNPSSKPDPTEPSSSILQPSQNVPLSVPPQVKSATGATYFVPSNKAKQSPPLIPPLIPSSVFLQESSVSSSVAPNYASMNIPPASSIFTTGSVSTKHQDVPTLIFQAQSEPPPTFFNPHAESSVYAPHPVIQMPSTVAQEVPKSVPEPPKAPGNVNFRMIKKRPQYYVGPIEGVGAITNNVKPIISPVMSSAKSDEPNNFQGALFTPEQPMQPSVEQYSTSTIEHASLPFDINMPVEQANMAVFDTSKPHENAYGTSFSMRQLESQNYEYEYNTPFDMCRDPIESYNQPKQESKGFGIIGSLKSKLSSIDINKIQSTVTTFFDPAYNDTKIAEPIRENNESNQQQHLGQVSQGQSSFDIFVPNVDQNQYSQYNPGFDNNHEGHHQIPYLENQNQNQIMSSYSTSSYFTDPNYSTEQVYTSNPLYDNTQRSHPVSSFISKENIPETSAVDSTKSNNSTSLFDPNAFVQENMSQGLQHPIHDVSKTEKSQQNIDYFIPDKTEQNKIRNLTSSHSQLNINQESSFDSAHDTSNMTFYNPTAFAQDNRQIWASQGSSVNSANFSQSFAHQKNFSAFAQEEDIKQISKSHPHFFQSNIQEDLSSKIQTSMSEVETVSQPSCDSALNTSKYNIASIQPHNIKQIAPTNVPLLPASSFFDNPISASISEYSKNNEIDNKADLTDKRDNQLFKLHKEPISYKCAEISNTSANVPTASSSKNQHDFAQVSECYKNIQFEKEVKPINLIESLSKDNIPVLGVSTVPLFGLSAIIADKTTELSKPEIHPEKTVFDTHQFDIFESKTGADFIENKVSENKIISENQVKTPLDITGLSIDDVKNVLVIEPPQENIGALLKRNASSSKLESLSEKPHTQVIKQQSDGNTAEIVYKLLGDIATETQEKKIQIATNVDEVHSELNICETCREVTTPEHEGKPKETEDLTSQLIENITSRMQLSHPLTVPFKEIGTAIVERTSYDGKQLDEITQVAEETFETLQVQSATELLDKCATSEVRDYGWTTEETVYPVTPHLNSNYASKVVSEPIPVLNYGLQLDVAVASNFGQGYELPDPNAIGFFGDNSLFFDNVPVPANASDEIKAEIKHSQEDIVLPRQMSLPTAPPEEEVLKLEEPGALDVHSIEQDANEDFPLEEEFIIEPSNDEFLSTDDDKIEFRERKRSSEDSTSNDTFTNRIEKFKKNTDNPDDTASEQKYDSPPISMASYFDTGNYAVESHYRNSLMTMRIPPGFEDEYARRLSGLSIRSENTTEPYIPETSTQTRPINTPTYSSSSEAKENVIGFEMRKKENDEALTQAFADTKPEETCIQTTDKPSIIAHPLIPHNTTTQLEILPQNVRSLSSPVNFFSANVEEPKLAEPVPEENFSRLASYFSMPPAQPEHSKSFFELSQSQNHYRHEPKTQDKQKSFFELSQSQNHYMDDDVKNNIKELMKDLTSPQNIKDQSIKTVNYFTVELQNNIKNNKAAPINIKLDEININKNVNSEKEISKPADNNSILKNIIPNSEKENKVINDDSKIKTNLKNDTKPLDNDSEEKYKECNEIINCERCCRYIPGINTKVRTAANEHTEPNSQSGMSTQKENGTKTGNNVNFANFDVEKQADGSVSVTNEHRATTEYTPVKHHWFYRLDVEEKSVWRGFSNTDSEALEQAFHSPDLNDSTLVATDGGRYDVNVVGRLRLAVYWKEKPTNVRRCSWFYKGTTDARYVPYTEVVAEKLEEEYRRGVTTGDWHRKMVLPNNEMVIMHGPTVMVHFLHSGAADAFTTPPQAASRPRVVRRSHEESEIEECEPSRIDHLLLLCHGVGSACDMRFRSVEEVVEDFRATSLQLLQSHYRNSYDNGLVNRVEVLPISWHEQLHAGETGVDRRLARVTLDSIPRLRAFTNHTVLDVLFYTSPVFHQTIIDTVCSELNRVYTMFRERNPHFEGEVSLGGHSLGSVILYDLLCHQSPESPLEPSKASKHCVNESSSTGHSDNYPQLVFPPAALYALGSPIAIFECIRGVETLGLEFALPTCKNFFNIFHPYDPIAYRIEPLINPQLQEVKPSQIPHHKGRKRMHLELKDTMARVGADLKQKLIESLRTTWNKWKSTPPPDGQLEKVVEEEMEKEQLTNEEEPNTEVVATVEMLGRLNGGRRVDYVLQEAPLEMINEYLFAMSSHVGYWESEDTMLLMLREIYDSLGVQPDCTVPQQSMTVQRTKTVQDETTKLVNESETPSTSRGAM